MITVADGKIDRMKHAYHGRIISILNKGQINKALRMLLIYNTVYKRVIN